MCMWLATPMSVRLWARQLEQMQQQQHEFQDAVAAAGPGHISVQGGWEEGEQAEEEGEGHTPSTTHSVPSYTRLTLAPCTTHTISLWSFRSKPRTPLHHPHCNTQHTR